MVQRPGRSPDDIDRKLQTTGHMLEWLVWSLPDEQLRDPKVEKTVDFLSGILVNNPDKAWSIGPMGHGLHCADDLSPADVQRAPLPTETVAGQTYNAPVKTASTLNPPEPCCEHETGSAAAKVDAAKADGERTDGCVESKASDDRLKVALRPSADFAFPAVAP